MGAVEAPVEDDAAIQVHDRPARGRDPRSHALARPLRVASDPAVVDRVEVLRADRYRLPGLLRREAADRLEAAAGRRIRIARRAGERAGGEREEARDPGARRPQDGGFVFRSDIRQ
jgi:hypothetical protein